MVRITTVCDETRRIFRTTRSIALREKIHAVLLSHEGHTRREIAEILYRTPDEIKSWLDLYKADGIGALRSISSPEPQAVPPQVQTEPANGKEQGAVESAPPEPAEVLSEAPISLSQEAQQLVLECLKYSPRIYGQRSRVWSTRALSAVLRRDLGERVPREDIQTFLESSGCARLTSRRVQRGNLDPAEPAEETEETAEAQDPQAEPEPEPAAEPEPEPEPEPERPSIEQPEPEPRLFPASYQWPSSYDFQDFLKEHGALSRAEYLVCFPHPMLFQATDEEGRILALEEQRLIVSNKVRRITQDMLKTPLEALAFFRGDRSPVYGKVHCLRPALPERDADFLELGSDPECDVCFEEASLAPRHATFVMGRSVSLVDAGSPGGTYFRGLPLSRTSSERLMNQDDFRLGEHFGLIYFTAHGFFEFMKACCQAIEGSIASGE